MSAKLDKHLIWHPLRENKFILGGGAQVALYEWAPLVPEFRLLGSQSDIQNLKCVSWFPDSQIDDLIAVSSGAPGSGKIELIRLDVGKTSKDLIVSNGVVGQVPILPSSKSCNALSFSPGNPNLLAVGLDRIRNESSLVVWDIANLMPPTSTGQKPGSPLNVTQQYSGVESITSLSFLHDSANLLVAGVAGNSLRLYDLRNANAHVAQVQCRIQGVAMDPFYSYRLASYGDGTVNVWDARKLTSQLIAFSAKDASGDGARYHPNDTFSTLEFSPTRRGVLATLLKDANHVRFWDIHNAPPMSDIIMDSIDRGQETIKEGSRTRKFSRLSWTTPSTILPWNAHSDQPTSPSVSDKSLNMSGVVLANTYRTKAYNRSLLSFLLVPSSLKIPTTTNLVVVNKDGDIEMHAVNDVPKHCAWSSRGDLAVGAFGQYQLYGVHSARATSDPWDIDMSENVVSRDERSTDRRSPSKPSKTHSRPTSPGFGRGDTDGFPPLLSTNNKGRLARPPSPSVNKSAGMLKAGMADDSPNRDHSPPTSSPIPRVTNKMKKAQVSLRGRRRFKDSSAPSCIENDVTILMKSRVLEGYGLTSFKHNQKICEKPLSVLAEVWTWINHSQQVLNLGSGRVHGFDFNFQGIEGIWKGLDATSSHHYDSQLDGLDLAGTSGSPPLAQGELSPGLGVSSSISSPFFSNRTTPNDAFHGNYLAALNLLNVSIEANKGIWKPTVHSTRTQHRRLALALVNFKIDDEELNRWEKEGKHPQAACWLLFTNQGARAIDVLMRSKVESHQMMSGTLAVLLQAGTSSKNPELHDYCERLVVKLQDPHFRIMVSYMVFNDWSDVIEEEALPIRERLSIALRFLDDKSLSSYLKRLADVCITNGSIEGLLVTGLTQRGLDVLQNFVDMSGDVQTAALLASLILPGQLKDARAERWIDTYRDLLDSWKLFHHRCQFDIDRGKAIQEEINAGNIRPVQWVKQQFLIRCTFCNKVVNPHFAHHQQTAQYVKPGACPSCGRSLPRCSVCLMSIGLATNAMGRDIDRVHQSSRDTADDAFVFCQACRHGGHATHIIEWFFGDGDETRPRRTCPVADCDCLCDEEY